MSLDTITQTLGLVLVLSFLAYLVYILFWFFIESIKQGRDGIILAFQNNVNGSLKDHYEKYLANKFAYYDKLLDKLKVKFLLRVRSFVSSKEFHGRSDLVVTEEMKVLVAASAIQLTFGLEKYLFDHFSKIIIYPDSYYSSIDEHYHKGETNMRGIIVFSWKDLCEGYDISNDAFNVGLHEMAHALELEQHLGSDYDFYFASYFEKWSLVAKEEFQNVRDERESYLRDYAGTNRQEFFAVCIEYFFEKSAEFKSRLPEIYYHLSALLNQDPLAADTELEEETTPDFNNMLAEVQSSSPIFTSRYSIVNSTTSFFILFIFALYVVGGASEAGMTILITSSIVFVSVFFIVLFFRLNTFILYDKYLVIENVFGKTESIYLLSKIVSVNLLGNRRNNYIQLLIPSNGRMKKFTHSYHMKEKDLETMTSLLREKKVLVKN